MKRLVMSILVFTGLLGLWVYQKKEVVLEDVEKVFTFEKMSVEAFEILFPDNSLIQISERDGEWWLTPGNVKASMTMVNRVRHQIHDLDVRALVKKSPEDLELYGLGPEAIVVTVQLRGDSEVRFEVGDPNPTGVSYYIRPLTGPLKGAVVTVAKGAVDYFESELSDLRSPHFVEFGLDSVNRFVITDFRAEEPKEWECYRESESDDTVFWIGKNEELEVPLSSDFVRRVLGRVLALKASEYIGPMDPRTNEFQQSVELEIHTNTERMVITIGQEVESGRSLFRIGQANEWAVARNGILEDLKMNRTNIQRTKILQRVLLDGTMWKSVVWDHTEPEILTLVKGQWKNGETEVPSDKMVDLVGLLKDFRRVPQDVEQAIQIESTVKIQTESESVVLSIGQKVHQESDGDLEERFFRVVSVKIGQRQAELVLAEEMWFTRFRDTWGSLIGKE